MMRSNYWRTLLANWRIWTVPQMVNIFYVPPTYRVLFANCVALVWNIYLARASRHASTFFFQKRRFCIICYI
jgi:Mpv17 / PMP22 family